MASIGGIASTFHLGGRLLAVLAFHGVDLTEQEGADLFEVSVRAIPQPRRLHRHSRDPGDPGGEPGGIVLLVEEPYQGETQGADLGLEAGIGGGTAEGTPETAANDRVVVASQQPFPKAREEGPRVGRWWRIGSWMERGIVMMC
jgi:hypothetical protein